MSESHLYWLIWVESTITILVLISIASTLRQILAVLSTPQEPKA